MVDLTDYKVPVFAGINGVPEVPTAQQAGNGSDLINRLNGLIDELQTKLDQVDDSLASAGSGGIPVLAESKIWYVDSVNGNDQNNDGLSSGNAFASLYAALYAAISHRNPDLYSRTIQLLDGDHTGAYLPGFISYGPSDFITIAGNSADPRAVTIGGEPCIQHTEPGRYQIENVKLVNASGSSSCIKVEKAHLRLGNIVFGQAGSSHVYARNQALVEFDSDYSIDDSAGDYHFELYNASIIDVAYNAMGRSATVAAGLSFNTFAVVGRNSYLSLPGTNFSNSATGTKYLAYGNSTIDAGGAANTLLPGDAAGTLEGNSQYI